MGWKILKDVLFQKEMKKRNEKFVSRRPLHIEPFLTAFEGLLSCVCVKSGTNVPK